MTARLKGQPLLKSESKNSSISSPKGCWVPNAGSLTEDSATNDPASNASTEEGMGVSLFVSDEVAVDHEFEG